MEKKIRSHIDLEKKILLMPHIGLEKIFQRRIWFGIKYLGEKNSGGGSSLKKMFQTRPAPKNFFQRFILCLCGNFWWWATSGEVSAAARPGLIPSTITTFSSLRLVRAQPISHSPPPPPPPTRDQSSLHRTPPARPRILPPPRSAQRTSVRTRLALLFAGQDKSTITCPNALNRYVLYVFQLIFRVAFALCRYE